MTNSEFVPAEEVTSTPVVTTTEQPLNTPQPSGRGPVGKIRNPFGVWVLSIITFGIYGLVWYYKVNVELKEFEPRIDVNPGLAVLALFVPIVNLVSVFNTGNRIAEAQLSARGIGSASALVGLLLCFLGGFHSIYYQAELNNLWRSQR